MFGSNEKLKIIEVEGLPAFMKENNCKTSENNLVLGESEQQETREEDVRSESGKFETVQIKIPPPFYMIALMGFWRVEGVK